MNNALEKYTQQFPQDGYLHYHAPRYSQLIQLLKQEHKPGARILDIGCSRFTEIVADTFGSSVDTLGLEPNAKTAFGRHYYFDLNSCQTLEAGENTIKPYDLIIFAEVVEHLYTSPTLVLDFLHTITSNGGSVLLQTPNAVALHKRLQMLIGKNPYEKIRDDNRNPGHFREYTKQEIQEYAEHTGFQVKTFMYGGYFDYRYTAHTKSSSAYKSHLRLVNYLYNIVPGSLKPGMTFVLTKASASQK